MLPKLTLSLAIFLHQSSKGLYICHFLQKKLLFHFATLGHEPRALRMRSKNIIAELILPFFFLI